MKKQYFLMISLLALATLLFQGCANTLSYSNAKVSFNAGGSGKLAVVTQDLRHYIISANKAPSFVGLVRGGYGNPFDVNTESGKPLAEEFTSALVSSFQKSGFSPVPVIVSPTASDDEVKKRIVAANSSKAILLHLKEWKSDTYANTSLLYEMTIYVLDGSGNLLAEKFINGTDSLGGSLNTYKHVHEAVPKAFAAKLEEFINTPEIQRALTADANTAPVVAGHAKKQAVAPVQHVLPEAADNVSVGQPTGVGIAPENQERSGADVSNVEARLEKLKRMFDKELISEDEYYRERRRVLGSM